MRKTTLQQRQIVMAVDRSTGILDLSVFSKFLQGGRTQTVGTAMLRMADVPEVVRPLTERLRAEDQLVRAESAARYSSTVFGAALDPPDLTDLRSHSSYPNSCPRSPIGLSVRTKSHLVKFMWAT
jgi:hypothetical protein